jgi:hypothetical protein
VLKPKEEKIEPDGSLHDQTARRAKLRKGDEFNEKQVVSFGFD